ncbi:MAG: patatin-like phospholipase family protein, partial [Candidatus Limnocylindrales bacterium]
MTTAFVLSGGGSLGAVQVGMLAALDERGLRPDLLVGTSVGALNAAYIAANGFDTGTVDRLAAVWQRVRRSDVFPFDPIRQALAIAGRRPSLCSPGPLRRLVEANLAIDDIAGVRIPLHIVVTDVMSGEEVLLSSGDLAAGVLASAALPAIFPPVELDGRVLIDGGVADNAAVSQAIALGADRVVVLPAGIACALTAPPASPIASAMHALTLLIQQRLIVEVAHLADRAEIIVLPPLCPLAVSPIDFGSSAELTSRAHRSTGEWLDTGSQHLPHQERFLSLHSHRHGGRHGPDPVAAGPHD